jgi:SAM-dependent methyltransferase
MFDQRATAEELIDLPDCSPELAADSYRFMEIVNSWFGGTRIVRRFVAAAAAEPRINGPMRILDIGSGSCDIPLSLSLWARAQRIPLQITCLETGSRAVAIARARLEQARDPAVQLLQQDVFFHRPPEPYDLAVASMCFHHFSDERICELVQRLRAFVRGGLLINDLRRSLPGLAGAGLLLALRKAPAGVRHDALLSIRRGFKADELRSLLRRLTGVSVRVTNERWFRIAAAINFLPGDSA